MSFTLPANQRRSHDLERSCTPRAAQESLRIGNSWVVAGAGAAVLFIAVFGPGVSVG